MKKQLLCAATLCSAFFSFSQISEGGLPTTFEKLEIGEVSAYQNDYQVVELSAPNMLEIHHEDNVNGEKGKPYRVAVEMPVNLSIQNSGTWTVLANGDKIWRLGVKVDGARALSLYFGDDVLIPAGGKLHAYNEKRSQYIGAYTANTPTFKSMELVQGELVTLEYFMPANASVLPQINIGRVAYYYRGFSSRIDGIEKSDAVVNQTKAHGSCQVDVACSETTGWEEQRDAVVHYSFSSGGGTYVCSGAMVNNTNTDCKPYFLTANHCGEPTTNAAIADHVYYFNYQRPNCNVGNTNTYNGARSETMSGGIFRASSELGNQSAGPNQVAGTDFLLIELSSNVPSSYNAYYAGWDRATTGSPSGVGIHHPAGDEKKISTYTSALSSDTYNGGWSNAHWEVQWASTTNGHGVTEGGSSGSPIFNSNGLVVGYLSGGSSFCTATSATDLYGKFNKGWNDEGNNNNQNLEHWLDPAGTGAMTLTGTYEPCDGTTGGGGTGGGGTGNGPCAATSTDCDEYISNVKLNTIDKTSACDNYSDFTSLSTTLEQGMSYNLTVEPSNSNGVGSVYTNDEIAAWIDWNNDNDFDDAGERIAYVIVANGWSNVFNFTVPANSVIGDLRMRVRMSYQPDDGDIVPCGETQWGEVEDYTVTIQEPNTDGIEERLLASVNLYPNPTNNLVTIDLSGIDVFEIELKDISGRIIETQSKIDDLVSFDLTNQPSGVYFVTVKSNSGNVTKKVIRL